MLPHHASKTEINTSHARYTFPISLQTEYALHIKQAKSKPTPPANKPLFNAYFHILGIFSIVVGKSSSLRNKLDDVHLSPRAIITPASRFSINYTKHRPRNLAFSTWFYLSENRSSIEVHRLETRDWITNARKSKDRNACNKYAFVNN